MARAAKVCSSPGCAELQPCAEHQRKPWEGSTRRQRTISGSRQQKRAKRILTLHQRRCHICGLPGATEADHVIPLAEGGADDETNLRPAHPWCHRKKSSTEAARGRARMQT